VSNPPSETMNTFPPRQSEYHGMIAEDRPLPAVSYVDPSVLRERSQLAGLQDIYSNDDGARWPVSGLDHQEGSLDASFRSHYSNYDEPAGADTMWPSQQIKEVRTENVMQCRFLKDVCSRFCISCCYNVAQFS